MADLERTLLGASRQDLAVAFVRRVYGDQLARRVGPALRQR